MRKSMNVVIPVAVTFVLVAVFVFLIGGRVHAQNQAEAERMWRENAESIYITEIRAFLSEEGFSDCGINMTKATNENGVWEYTVIIYHSSFQWLENADKIEMEKDMEELGKDVLGKISLALLSR